MLIINLEGEEHDWKPSGKSSYNSTRPCSNLHKKARKLLQELYPLELILEEVGIPVTEDKTLYLDFYIPAIKLSIEVCGRQHFEYISFFYKNKLEFLKAQTNDKYKIQYCELNNITLIHLKYNEEQLWEKQMKIC